MNDSVSQAVSGKSRDFQSQLAASQVAASLDGGEGQLMEMEMLDAHDPLPETLDKVASASTQIIRR